MKSFTSIFMLCVFMAASLSAQDGRRGHKKERIQALRIAFITEQLDLTEKESEKFWPVYNEFQKERKELREKYKGKEGTNVTDADAVVNASFAFQEKELKLKRTYYERFKKIIPSDKIVKLERAEKEFRREVVKEIKRRKRERREGKQ